MTNTAKRTACIFGILIGIAIIIAGICVQAVNTISPTTPPIGKSIYFGADFYTEMYKVTKDVGEAVNNATTDLCHAMNRGVQSVCTALGWLIIALGATDICFFTYKLAKTTDASPLENVQNIDKHVQLLATPMIKKEEKARREAEERAAREAEERAAREAEERAAREAEERAAREEEFKNQTFSCPHCGNAVHFGDATCASCGQAFDWSVL